VDALLKIARLAATVKVLERLGEGLGAGRVERQYVECAPIVGVLPDFSSDGIWPGSA
jgi:hypothetical protein